MTMKSFKACFALAAALALVGCGDDGGRSDGLGNGGTGTDGIGDGGDGGTGDGDGSGDDGGDDGGDGGGGPAGDALEKLIEAQCGWLFGCCTRGELDVLLGPFTTGTADCVDRVIAALESGNSEPPVEAGPSDLLLYLIFALNDGRVQLDDAGVDACVAELADTPCTEPPPGTEDDEHCTPEVPEVPSEACAPERIFVGTQQLGEECTPSQPFECVPGLECVSFGEIGVCAEPAVEGDYCFTDADCAEPLICDFEVGLCANGSGVGEPCSYNDPESPIPGTEAQRCEPGLSCDPTNLVCVGTCAPGSPCTIDYECPELHVCVLGACRTPGAGGADCEEAGDCISGVCEAATTTCKPVVNLGEPCTIHTECSSGFCHPSNIVCAPQQPVGQPCTTNQDAECLDGFCDTAQAPAVCVAYGGNGAPCDYSNPCAEDFGCVGGTCTPKPLLNGSPCVANDDCVSELCWYNFCEAKAGPGAACGEGANDKPCQDAAYCDIELDDQGLPVGTCRNKVDSGAACDADEQCWGQCIVAWGRRMCDGTPEGGAAWCDGT
jgi:hypothetical protein